MENQEKKIWFRNRYFGWGWRPVTWQGWLILLAYIAADFILIRSFNLEHSSSGKTVAEFLVGIAILTAILFATCYKYGEESHWNWGFNDSNNKNGNNK